MLANVYPSVMFDTPAFVHKLIKFPVSNGNRTERSPIRSVIIQVINKIGRPRSGSPICLITSMITDRIGRHKVLLPINHNYYMTSSVSGQDEANLVL